ncbi:IclR family transcriptional regulator C-terminal domain-containing protein [Phyllobacterium sp. OV277]|uniref:IclR family transcriptional regulator domain-containing protein n=1 Tax=Phyllobacterium sp. OV277 TaxID=1882772 RepID=UPI000B831A23|nr:IclR family transcriptional regulator C-terminal domain-containing protein [Phyllobacterium sp. OV277]
MDEFLHEAELSRLRGYSIDDGQIREGMICIGAPIRDFTDNPVAKLLIRSKLKRVAHWSSSQTRFRKNWVPSNNFAGAIGGKKISALFIGLPLNSRSFMLFAYRLKTYRSFSKRIDLTLIA